MSYSTCLADAVVTLFRVNSCFSWFRLFCGERCPPLRAWDRWVAALYDDPILPAVPGGLQERCCRRNRAAPSFATRLTTRSGTPTAAVLVVVVLACEPDGADTITLTLTA
jgi:hypothetical protein